MHYLSLHYAASVELVAGVYQKHSPSVPITHPAYTLYDEQVDREIQPVPEVVHYVVATNAEHPEWVSILVVASEHN